MIHNKTLLWSGDVTASITLPEPLSAFERYRVKTNPGVYWESICTADRSVQRFNRYGSWSNDGYMEWPANWVISNGTKKMDCNRFQLLQQNGTTATTQTFGFNNTAGNVKSILEVWGINRINGEESGGSGKPEGEGWKAYNETLLWSGTDWASQNHIDLSGRALEYERLKVGVGSFTESTNIYEVDAPTTYTSWLPLRSYWGTSTGSFYLSMHRYKWDNNTSGLSAVSGKTWQLGTGAATPYTTTGNYTATDTFVRRPLFAVWGINKKSPHKLTLIPPTAGGTQSASETSGYEYDTVTLSNTPDEDWYFSGYNITGATLTGNKFTFGDSDVTAQAVFADTPQIKTLTLQTDGHGTLTANAVTGYEGDTVTLSNNHADYYRFKDYTVTGGTVNGNTYTFGSAQEQTAKANFTANKFTITGNYNYAQTTYTANWDAKVRSIAGKNVPTSWGTVGNNFNPGSCSAYGFTFKTTMNGWYERGSSTAVLVHKIAGTFVKSGQVTGYGSFSNYTNSVTVTGTSTKTGHPTVSARINCTYNRHTNGMPTNGWTATGYIK